jgi:hypothetical protein
MKNLNDIFSGVDHVLNSAKHGNFEEVLTKTKNYAEQATKKSAERIEISKKKIELLDTKTKLNKAYEAFGKIQYDAYIGEEIEEDEIQAKLQEIQLFKSRAELLDAEITALHDELIDSVIMKEAQDTQDVNIEADE